VKKVATITTTLKRMARRESGDGGGNGLIGRTELDIHDLFLR